MKLVTEYSNINEIREWLDFYGVRYKKNERKASLVKKMDKVREVFREEGTVEEYNTSLLSPNDARKIQNIDNLLKSIRVMSMVSGEYIDNALKENEVIDQRKSIIRDVTESVAEVDNTDTESSSVKDGGAESVTEQNYSSSTDEVDEQQTSEVTTEDFDGADIDSDEESLPVTNQETESVVSEIVSEGDSGIVISRKALYLIAGVLIALVIIAAILAGVLL
jgi:hypothetical protein